MTWMKYRPKFREGIETSWEWYELGVPLDKAEEVAKDARISLATEYYDNEGFRGFDYEIVETPPHEALIKLLKELEVSAIHYERRIAEVQGMLRGFHPSTLDDWIEVEIGRRFPDDLAIPIGQLRVRIFMLVQEALARKP